MQVLRESFVWMAVGAMAGCGGAAQNVRASSADVAIQVFRVFDGTNVLEHQTVLVDDGHIVAIGPAASVAVPPGAPVVDGRGKTLLPGLIDAHVHVNSDDEPQQALDF